MKIESPQTETLKGMKVLWPVCFSLPNDQRKADLYEYMSEIGRGSQADAIWDEVKNYNPLAHDSYDRQGYTKEQRLWIKHKRDESHDQSPFAHITPETVNLIKEYGIVISEPFQLQLHHIWAQAYLQAFLGLTNHPELISPPENGATLSKIAHVGPWIPNINESRHNDVYLASTQYKSGSDSFRHIFDSHWRMAQNGIKYWFAGDDRKMFEIARERTRRMYEKAGRTYGKT